MFDMFVRRSCGIFLVGMPLLAAGQIQPVAPMAKTAQPAFDVASIKPAQPEARRQGFHTDGASLFYENESMRNLISFAYGVHRKQIVNEPDWFSTARFDIRGHADAPGQPDNAQQQEMLRKLLEERFGLKLHHDKRDLPALVLALVDAKKLTPNSSHDSLPDQTGSMDDSTARWRFTNNSMDDFAQFLGNMQERPVVNQTGLTGRYDFKLDWLRDTAVSANHPDLPSLPTALQEQAGLSVKRVQTPVDVLVIDAVHPPAAD